MGTIVQHEKHGQGTVVEHLKDGFSKVDFESGDSHSYTTVSAKSKLKRVVTGDDPAEEWEREWCPWGSDHDILSVVQL